ncbi:hypothetical protein [Blastomonas sp.]|uniref:hypothetical protein n=1 Tax=Blastomonas sp. TaxID=1909299 RepID=UPI003919691C
MRLIILLCAPLALISAKNIPAPVAQPESPPALHDQKTSALSEQECRDRITLARDAAGQPPLLDRGPASPDDTFLIYAVDKKVDGCAVMVIKDNVDDIRPLPKPSTGPTRLIPLNPKG